MALLEQNYEGQTDGTNVTIANSTTYGDDPASSVVATNGTVTYSTADKMHGSRSLALNLNSGATNGVACIGLNTGSATSLAARGYLKLGSAPSSPVRILLLESAVGGSNLGGINYYANGTLAMVDAAGTVLAQSSSSTQVISNTTWYRIEAAWKISATVGSYKMAVYVGDSASPWFSYTSPTTMNSGTTPIGEVRIGKTSSTGVITAPWRLDDFAVNTASTSFIGPYVQAGPSIAVALTPGYLKLDATGSHAVSTGALTYSISPSTGVTQSPTGVFYIPQGSTAAAYTLTVNEASGGTSSQVVTVPALTAASSSQTTVMTQKWLSGSWR